LEVTKASEMAATIDQLTNWHNVIARRIWIVINSSVRTSFCTVVMICCFLQCIFVVDKITAGFVSDTNILRCHHALRHQFSPHQCIICGEWWVWRILCTHLASCCLQDYQCHVQTSEYRLWHLLVCLAHGVEETLVTFYIHSDCFFSGFNPYPTNVENRVSF
jgi:hypothetical protein